MTTADDIRHKVAITHQLDEVTSNCIACGATREWMLDHSSDPCVPDGKPHPRKAGIFDPIQVIS